MKNYYFNLDLCYQYRNFIREEAVQSLWDGKDNRIRREWVFSGVF